MSAAVPPDETVARRIAVGVAGWSYPDWDGFVYAAGVKDKLRYVAGFVDLIEINSTFYRPPDPRTAESWRRRTDDCPGFFFTAKLHQDVTHGGVVAPEMIRAFREGFRPLIEAGKLRHLLAQFRYDFADTPAARAHLQRVRDGFASLAHLTVEVRHRSWQEPEGLGYLAALGVGVANLDYPATHSGFNLRQTGVGEHAYFRLHGRNVGAWFSKAAGRDETYNYLYSRAEREEVARRALDIARMSKSLALVANNHYQGKEMVNALQLKAMLSGARVAVPPPLAAKYPELAEIARQD
jgi:uncharacterized protein YecE (DUF72 family)